MSLARGVRALLVALLAAWPVFSAAASRATPGAGAADDAVILEDALAIDLRSPSDARERRRTRVLILTAKGAETYQTVVVDYEQGVTVTKLEASVTQPSGKVTRLASRDVVDQSAWGGYELYSDLRLRTARLIGVTPGCIVETSYEKSLTNVVRLPDVFPLQREVPAKLLTLSVTTTAGLPLRFAVRNAETEHSVEESGETVTHRWTVRDVPAARLEPEAPPLEDLLPRILFTPSSMNWQGHRIDATSWDGIARFQWELTAGRLQTTPEIQRLARELTDGATNTAEKVRRIYEFVQGKVNYVAVELGIGGYQPHASADVLRYQYGDCKDKATLMLSLLRALDVTGYPVLIRTRDNGLLDPQVPALAFNHAIVAIPAEAGYMFLDPTSTVTRYGDLPWVDQGASALVVRPDGTGEFLITEPSPPSKNSRRVTVTAYVSSSGDLEGSMIVQARGQRRDGLAWLMRQGPADLREQVVRVLDELVAGARLKSHKLEAPLEDPDEIRLTLDFSVPGYLMRAGPLEILRPHIVRLGDLLSLSGASDRRQPVFFPFLFDERIETRLFLPPGRVLKQLPGPLKAEGPGMSGEVSYETGTERGRGYIDVKRAVSISQREIGRAQYASLREFVARLAEDESRAVTLRPASTP